MPYPSAADCWRASPPWCWPPPAWSSRRAPPPRVAAACDTATNIALNKPATASSVQGNGYLPAKAVDGNAATRWSSQFSDPQWIQVDLGAGTAVCQVVVNWQTSYAKAFRLELSADGSAAGRRSTPPPPTPAACRRINATGTGRYLRVYGTQRATGYGYSIKELTVHSGSTERRRSARRRRRCRRTSARTWSCSTRRCPARPSRARLDSDLRPAGAQPVRHPRYALLFKPGTYSGSTPTSASTPRCWAWAATRTTSRSTAT